MQGTARLMNHAIKLARMAMAIVENDPVAASRLTTIIDELTSGRDNTSPAYAQDPHLSRLIMHAIDAKLAEVQGIVGGSGQAS